MSKASSIKTAHLQPEPRTATSGESDDDETVKYQTPKQKFDPIQVENPRAPESVEPTQERNRGTALEDTERVAKAFDEPKGRLLGKYLPSFGGLGGKGKAVAASTSTERINVLAEPTTPTRTSAIPPTVSDDKDSPQWIWGRAPTKSGVSDPDTNPFSRQYPEHYEAMFPEGGPAWKPVYPENFGRPTKEPEGEGEKDPDEPTESGNAGGGGGPVDPPKEPRPPQGPGDPGDPGNRWGPRGPWGPGGPGGPGYPGGPGGPWYPGVPNPPAGPPIGAPKEPKAMVPDDFSGKREDWMPFVVQTFMYFSHFPEYFRHDRNRCLYFLRWFGEGAPRAWATSILGTLGTPNESIYVNQWGDLLAHAALLWGPINEQQSAAEELRKIQQQTTVTAYHVAFMRWSGVSGYNEVALVDAFYRGLKPALKDMILNVRKPTTVEGMLNLALDCEQRYLERARERGPGERKPFEKRKPATTKAMRLSPEERTKRMKEGRCFLCNRTGHMARNCPDRPKKVENKALKEEEAEGEETPEQGFLEG